MHDALASFLFVSGLYWIHSPCRTRGQVFPQGFQVSHLWGRQRPVLGHERSERSPQSGADTSLAPHVGIVAPGHAASLIYRPSCADRESLAGGRETNKARGQIRHVQAGALVVLKQRREEREEQIREHACDALRRRRRLHGRSRALENPIAQAPTHSRLQALLRHVFWQLRGCTLVVNLVTNQNLMGFWATAPLYSYFSYQRTRFYCYYDYWGRREQPQGRGAAALGVVTGGCAHAG